MSMEFSNNSWNLLSLSPSVVASFLYWVMSRKDPTIQIGFADSSEIILVESCP